MPFICKEKRSVKYLCEMLSGTKEARRIVYMYIRVAFSWHDLGLTRTNEVQ